MKQHRFLKTAGALALALLVMVGATLASANTWKFGVMSDTQWKADADGQNPDTIAVGIINQLNEQFINHGVKFVIQVGDLVDKETNSPNALPLERTMPARALAAQALYDAGIGFYPLRGNHEGSAIAAAEFQTLYPQSTGDGPYVFGGEDFSSPFATLNGLSYSFDYHNARFVLLDQFKRTDNTDNTGGTNNNILDQLTWIDTQLSTRPDESHAFVFSHKNLIGQNHADDLFGSNPSGNPVGRSAFISSLHDNGVRYLMSGHDHMHHRAIVQSPQANADGTFSEVQEIICASDSYKFYVPQNPSNDALFNFPAFGFTLETPIAQELFNVGYYIVTVDGPRVTVDHYAAPNGCGGDCDLVTTPALTFAKRETFGYSLNGKEFLVPQGADFTIVEDRYKGTTAKILSGSNNSAATDVANRPLTLAVDTGWSHKTCETHSAILSLWGMAGTLGSDQTDVYTLSMSYNADSVDRPGVKKGRFGLVTRNDDGEWVNAVEKNTGGAKKFVRGAWHPGYELGTYGIDSRSQTAWAVINYASDFAVATFEDARSKQEGHGSHWKRCRDDRGNDSGDNDRDGHSESRW